MLTCTPGLLVHRTIGRRSPVTLGIVRRSPTGRRSTESRASRQRPTTPRVVRESFRNDQGSASDSRAASGHTRRSTSRGRTRRSAPRTARSRSPCPAVSLGTVGQVTPGASTSSCAISGASAGRRRTTTVYTSKASGIGVAWHRSVLDGGSSATLARRLPSSRPRDARSLPPRVGHVVARLQRGTTYRTTTTRHLARWL
jgi:hypothetical protein